MTPVKLDVQSSSPKSGKRPYRMRRRAEQVDQTRLRITEAAVRLHTSVGPSATSMAAVADEAGVTRLTLYRHFSSKDELFVACMSHWRELHRPPDPAGWSRVEEFEERVRFALRAMYRWYDRNQADLYPIYRDAAFTPESNQRARQANSDRIVESIVGTGRGRARSRRRARAALGHLIGFWAWRSLAIDQGLGTDAAAKLATRFVLASA